MSERSDWVIGYDASAYERRPKGYSPEPIREAAWALVGQSIGGVVLDIGSGAGYWVERMKQNQFVQRVISVDIVDDGASKIAGVEFHLADVSYDALPCVSSVADWIFAIEVIEQLANPRHFVAEAHRSLKPGGNLFITTPCNDNLTARLSFLFRGFFPAFCDHNYHESGHITMITELDVRRMAVEAGFKKVEFYYPLPGRIPKSSMHWQKLFPSLRGELWSDGLFALLTK
jgi:SAM-dependent methyltransferase